MGRSYDENMQALYYAMECHKRRLPYDPIQSIPTATSWADIVRHYQARLRPSSEPVVREELILA